MEQPFQDGRQCCKSLKFRVLCWLAAASCSQEGCRGSQDGLLSLLNIPWGRGRTQLNQGVTLQVQDAFGEELDVSLGQAGSA